MRNSEDGSPKVTLPPVAQIRPTDIIIEKNSIKPDGLLTRTLDEQS